MSSDIRTKICGLSTAETLEADLQMNEIAFPDGLTITLNVKEEQIPTEETPE